MTSVCISAVAGSARSKVRYQHALILAADGAGKNDHGVSGFRLAQDLEGAMDALGPRERGRIIKGDCEIRLAGEPQPLFDGGPGLQVVRQRYGAEIVARAERLCVLQPRASP